MQIKTETKIGFFIFIALIIFILMIFGIGAFKFSNSGYYEYKISFTDISNLLKKSEVKIAGVKVGYVNSIILVPNENYVLVKILVKKNYKLYENSYAIIKQEGFMGSKYLEVFPGNPILATLKSGESLAKGEDSFSVEKLISKVSNIANNVEEISVSFKNACSENILKDTFKNFNIFSNSLNNIFTNNQEKIKDLIINFSDFSKIIKNDAPQLKKLALSLENNFEKITTSFKNSSNSINDAASEARDAFQNLSSISEKINNGKGLLGKLINEEEIYQDIKTTVNGMKNYIAKFDSLGIILDMHFESMYRPVDDFKYSDSKGYFNIKIHTSDNFFYLGQIAVSEKGFISRKYIYRNYFNECGEKINYSNLSPEGSTILNSTAEQNFNKFMFAPEFVETIRNPTSFGFQFGKIYNDIAFRIGLLEGSFGFGIDYFIPLKNKKLSWISTFEAFDFSGLKRFDREEGVPHLKWLNKLFFLSNIYFTFGADDFISKNASTFWGLGIRFGDNDIKYILSKVGIYITT